MNLASVLLCLIFAAMGYVMHPMLLSALVDSKVVAESSLSDIYKQEQEKALIKSEGNIEPESVKPEVKRETESSPVQVKPLVTEKHEEPASVIPTPAPNLAPAPVTATEQSQAEVKLDDEAFIKVLQNSVKAGDVTEFKFDQVLGWKRLGEQLIDGGTYDVGLVVYSAETIFGMQKIQAKALVKDGRVVKWLWATTNIQMR